MKRLPALAAGLLAVLLVAATFAVGELRAQARSAGADAAVTQESQA